MPYIAASDRAQYEPLVTDFIESVDQSNWTRRFLALVLSVGEELYGDSKNTRYFLQNEFGGVLICAAQEWVRRYHESQELEIPELEHEAIPEEAPNSLCSFLALQLAGTIPRDDVTQRPGHLNYFFTSLLIAACDKKLVDKQFVPKLLLLAHKVWYASVTGPYEDQAIAKNGDCFPAQLLAV